MPEAPDALIYNDIISVMDALKVAGHCEYVGSGFVNIFKNGQKFPAVMIIQVDTPFNEEKHGAKRTATFHILYCVKILSGQDVNVELSRIREYIIGRDDVADPFDGGLKKDTSRGGNAQGTYIGNERRSANALRLATGLPAPGLNPPYGIGLLPVTCPYRTRWR